MGLKFCKFTKPTQVKFNKLYVSCKSPIIEQELTMFKSDLIKKINKYAQPLELNILDLVFNYKNWGEDVNFEEIEDTNFIEYDESELEKITLDENELIQIKKNIELLEMPDDTKEKYLKKIINSIKAEKLRGRLNFS